MVEGAEASGSRYLQIGLAAARKFGWDWHSTEDMAQIAALALWRKKPKTLHHERRVALSAIIDWLRVQPGGTRTARKPELHGQPIEKEGNLDGTAMVDLEDLFVGCPWPDMAKEILLCQMQQRDYAEREGFDRSTISLRMTKVKEWLKRRYCL